MTTSNIFGFQDTWNDVGTTFNAIKVSVTDTASASASSLIDLEVGGTSQFKVGKDGSVTFEGTLKGIEYNPAGAVVGQSLGFPNSISVVEPYTPAGAGDILKAADENISGIFAGGQADTIAELEARSVSGLSDGDVCYVSDEYRWGHFRWTTGSQSGNVTADTKQGIWVAPSSDATGASGAWQRIYSGSIFADWFIEPGDSDDTDGIQAALDYASANEGAGAEGQRGATVVLARRDYVTSSEIKPDTLGYVALQGQGAPASNESNVNLGGTTIQATHTTGAVFRIVSGPFRFEHLHITASSARKTGGTTDDHGIHFEAEDDEQSASRISYAQMKNVRVTNQPGAGVAVIGEAVSTDLSGVQALENGFHGILIDRGDATGRVHTMLGGTRLEDGNITSGSTTLTSASASFVGGDAGDRILVKGAGANGYDLETTIDSVTSGTEVELSQSAATTVSDVVTVYGGTWARPGLGTLLNCLTADNGGHGLALGHPANRSKTPYRFIIDNHESFRNVATSSLKYSNHDSWLGGEQISYLSSATGAESSRNNLFVQGQNIKVENFRGISPSSHYIQVAGEAEARTLNGVDTGLTRFETNDILIDGLNAGGTPSASSIRIDDHEGAVRVFGVDGLAGGVPLFNATRKNVTYIHDGKLVTTGSFTLKRSATSDLALNFDGNLTTGINSASGDSFNFVAAGTAVAGVSASGIVLATGYQLSVPRGSAAAPAVNISVETDTGLFSRTSNEIGFAVSGAEALRCNGTQVMSGSRGTAAAPAFSFTVDGDTGIYSRTANEVSGSVAGSEVWRTTSSGFDLRSGDLLHSGTKVVGAQVVDANLADTAALTAQTLTDNSGGSASDTIGAIGATYSQTEVADAIASLADEINKLRADNAAQKAALDAALTLIRTHGLGATS